MDMIAINKFQKKFQLELVAIGQQVISELCCDIFSHHPELFGVVWTQFIARREYEEEDNDDNYIAIPNALLANNLAFGMALHRTPVITINEQRYHIIKPRLMINKLPALTIRLYELLNNVKEMKEPLAAVLGKGVRVTAHRTSTGSVNYVTSKQWTRNFDNHEDLDTTACLDNW